MNKSIKIFFALIAVLSLPFAMSAQDAEKAKKTQRAPTSEVRANAKALVETAENGDVTIKRNPKAIKPDLDSAKNIPAELISLLWQIEPELDFNKLNDTLEKKAGKSNKLNVFMDATDSYLSTLGIRLKETKFSEGSVRSKLDEGLPLFLMYKTNPELDTISSRMPARKSASDMKVWAKEVLKLKVKNFHSQKNMISFALIYGYNKTTGEFLVEKTGNRFWVLGDEIKSIIHELYEVRF